MSWLKKPNDSQVSVSLLEARIWRIEKTDNDATDAAVITSNPKDAFYQTMQRIKQISEAKSGKSKIRLPGYKGTKIIDYLLGPNEKRAEKPEPISKDTRIGAAVGIKIEYPKEMLHTIREELGKIILGDDDIASDYLRNNHKPRTNMAFCDAKTMGKHYKMVVELNNRLMRPGWIQGIYGVGIAKHLEDIFNRFSPLPPGKTERTFTFYQR